MSNQLDQLLISCRDNPTDKFLWEVTRDLCEEIHGHRMIELHIPSFPLLESEMRRNWRRNGWDYSWGVFTRRYSRVSESPFQPSQLENLAFLFDASNFQTYQPEPIVFDRELNPEENRQVEQHIFTMYGVFLPPRE